MAKLVFFFEKVKFAMPRLSIAIPWQTALQLSLLTTIYSPTYSPTFIWSYISLKQY